MIVSLLKHTKQRLPKGLGWPVIVTGFVLLLTATALLVYGAIVTTRLLTSSHAEASPEELFQTGYIGKSLAQGVHRVNNTLDTHGASSAETGDAFISLAQLLNAAGESDKAAAMLDQAGIVVDNLAVDNPQAAVRSALELADVSIHMGDANRAADAAKRAVDIADKAGLPMLRMRSLACYGASLAYAGQADASRAAYLEAVSVLDTQKLPPSSETISLLLDAARAAVLADDTQQARSMLYRVRKDMRAMHDAGTDLLDLRTKALEARVLAAEKQCATAVQFGNAALNAAGTLAPDMQRAFAISSGDDMLTTMRQCADDAAARLSVIAFLEQLTPFLETALSPDDALHTQALEQLSNLTDDQAQPGQALAINAKLLDAQATPAVDNQGNGFDSLMDRDAKLMALLAGLADVNSPPQDIATLSFGAWLCRRVLFPPTGAPVLMATAQDGSPEADASDTALLQEFNRLTAAMAHTTRVIPHTSGAHATRRIEPTLLTQEAQKRLADLSQSIAERQAALKPMLQWTTGRNDGYEAAVHSLAATLPERGGLLFFARTRPPRESDESATSPHVLAFLLTRSTQNNASGSRVQVLDIGTVHDIDKAVAAWRKARSSKDDDGSAAVTLGLAEVELYSMLWAPVRHAAPELRTIWIGPSDPPSRNLALLPHGTLPTPEGAPLADTMHLRWMDRDELLASMQDAAVQQPMVGLLRKSSQQ